MSKSTRQLLVKIPNHQCLYRHEKNGRYYGITKIRGNRKERSLGTTDRKYAERLLKEWLADVEITEGAATRMVLQSLLEAYERGLAGKAEKTRKTRASILKKFRSTWPHGERIDVADIKPSQLNDWLALHESRLKNTSYNEYARFLKNLFEIAVHDRVIARSPFEGVKTKWKKPQKPIRLTPTPEQFDAIVQDIRAQKFNADAEDSADFIEFLGEAGLGQKETANVQWSDIDFLRKRIGFRRHKTAILFYVPIYPRLHNLLERLKAKRTATGEKPSGRVLCMSDAKKALAGACARLGLPGFSQRAIRRVLIQRLWKAGVDKKLIAKWQGHSDGGKLILDTYTEAFGSDDDKYEQQELAKIA
jgi:integrase